MVYVANNGTNDIFVTTSKDDGAVWSAPTNIGQKSKATPAIQFETYPKGDTVGEELIIVYVADNSSNDLLMTTSANGTKWSADTRVGRESSAMGPSIDSASCLDVDLLMAYVANDSSNDLIITSASIADNTGAITWSTYATVGTQASKFSPVLSTDSAYCNPVIAYVANNSSNDLLVTTSTDREASDWSAPVTVDGEASKTAPTLGETQSGSGVETMAYVANNSSNDLLVTTSNDGDATDWSPSILVTGQSSKTAPAIPDVITMPTIPMIYVANNSNDHLLLTTSGNEGDTWSTPSKVDSGPKAQ